MSSVNLKNFHALVTGASSGIGAATAVELARAGCSQVSIAARRRERLEEVARQIESAGAKAHLFAVDLDEPGAARKLAATVEQQVGPVDLLMNNAGVSGGASLFVKKSPEEVDQTIQVNLAAPVQLVHALLPGMVKRRRGALVSVSSGFGLIATPQSSVYCATKAGLSMLDEVLRMETVGTGVHVLSVYPGPVETEMLQATRQGSKLASQLGRMPTGTPEECAKKIRAALESGRTELHYPEIYGTLVGVGRPLSRAIFKAARPFLERRGK